MSFVRGQTILVFSGMPDLVVESEITLDIVLQVKSKMADICPRSNNRNWYQFRLRYAQPSGVVKI